MKVWRWILGGVVLAGAASCVALGDFASDDPGFTEAPGTFEGRFLALADASMAGTAYGDNLLEPFEGMRDELILFEEGEARAVIEASNSVVSWPQILDISPDGRFAYVVETRGNLDPSIEAVDDVYKDMPGGRLLSVFGVDDGALTLLQEVEVGGASPQSVEAPEALPLLYIATETDGAELVTFSVSGDGAVEDRRAFDLEPPYLPEDAEKRIRTLVVAPDGVTFAANIGNKRVQFYRTVLDLDQRPQEVEKIGEAIEFGVRLSTMKWTPDGSFLIVTDVNSYDSTLAMLTQKGGQVFVIAPPDGEAAARVVDQARVGRFAEGVELSDDGRYIASIAMERTYLPELFFLEAWPRRRQYSLMLLELEPETGALSVMDEIRVAGVLPEDVIFDESGRNLAVATFHRRKGADRQRGFIDFFSIEDGKLVAQDRTQATMRGPHDLVRIP
ncbi:MAG: beta-propeller fold lactonase family protein [Pseudomonadota bacterium]